MGRDGAENGGREGDVREQTCKAQLEGWVSAQVRARNPVQLPDLVDEAVTVFCGDGKWVRRFVKETMRATIYDVALKVIQRGRPGETGAGPIAHADTIADRKTMREILESTPAEWERASGKLANWSEYDPINREHFRFIDAKYEQVISAIGWRQKRIDSETKYIDLMGAVAARMEPGQIVSETWGAAELERLAVEHGVLKTRGDAERADPYAQAAD